MRIDLFMVQRGLEARVEEVCVCGRGADMQGFLGSDHCPVLLRLREGAWAWWCAPKPFTGGGVGGGGGGYDVDAAAVK